MLCGMRKREVRARRAAGVKDFARSFVKNQLGCARLVRADFDIPPTHAAAPTRAQSFQRRLFRGEARGVVLRGGRPARVAVIAFGFRENAHAETRRALDDFTHALDFDKVYADGNNHG